MTPTTEFPVFLELKKHTRILRRHSESQMLGHVPVEAQKEAVGQFVWFEECTLPLWNDLA